MIFAAIFGTIAAYTVLATTVFYIFANSVVRAYAMRNDWQNHV